MAGESHSNGNRELERLSTSIEFMRADIAEIKGSVTPLTGMIAKHESRLDNHDQQFNAVWRRLDGAWVRAGILVSIASVVAGAVAYVVRGIG